MGEFVYFDVIQPFSFALGKAWPAKAKLWFQQGRVPRSHAHPLITPCANPD